MRKRIMFVFLCVIMLLTSIPFGTVYAEEADEDTEWKMNPGRYIGNVATFNVADWSNYHVFYDPAVYVDDYWEDDAYWLYNEYSDEGKDEIPDDNVQLVIVNYYYDEIREFLWYEVEAAPGYELPEKLKNNPYVLHRDSTDFPPSLYLSENGQNYIFDEEGNALAEVALPLYEKKILKSESSLQGNVNYQWQIYSDGQWIDIHGEDEAEIKINIGMFINVLDENLQANLRCVSSSGSKTVEGDAIPVTIVLPETAGTDEPAAAAYSLRSASVSAGDRIAFTAEGVLYDVEVVDDSEPKVPATVTVKFVYGSNGQAVAADRIYDSGDVSYTFDLPVMEGYDAYLEDDTETIYTSYTLDLKDVTEDIVITFKYWPAKVNYTVIYYLQNAEDDGYSEYYRYTDSDFTGNIATVDDEYEIEGAYALLYEQVPIASDGSTVVEVYYDRIYYKMLFDLDGGYGVQPIYARWGTSLNLPNPTKAGHSFKGWEDITDGTSDDSIDGLPNEIPRKDTKYKALWIENDVAKVSIVYWGENANDEGYSYIKSQEIYVKPGTELVFGSDNLVCSLTEHTHDESCGASTCSLEEHTHTVVNGCYSCGSEEHDHVAGCYDVTYTRNGNNSGVTITKITDNVLITQLEVSEAWENGVVRLGNNNNYTYYKKEGGKWYRLRRNNGFREDGTVTFTVKCGKEQHSHTASCLSCKKTEHVHGDSCDRECGLTAHTHTAACYFEATSMENTLWTFIKADEVTVETDGSTVMNVYYDRTTFTLTFRANSSTVATITDKWGASISKKFEADPFNTTYNGRAWQCTESSKYGYALQTLDIMPQFDATFNLYDKSTDTLKTIYYYVENVGANVSENSWPSNTNNFTLLKTVQTYFSYATYEEEYHEIQGLKRYSASVAGFNGNQKNFSNKTLYLYYLRGNTILVFNNGENNVKTESVLYEAPLSSYSTFTPEPPAIYEPGSVTFAGWYLNPECSGDEYVLNNHTMPSENLLLYAKWEPVLHDVRFYQMESLVGTDSIYDTYKQIPHGELIQEEHIPKDPVRGQYDFVGWFYVDKNGIEQMWDFTSTTVTMDTDIYAKWSSKTLVNYEVRFVYKDENGDEHEIADPIIGSSLGGNSKTFDAKGNDQLYEGYQTGYFPQVQSHTIVMDLDVLSNNRFVFYYDKIDYVPYTVYYLEAGTDNNVVGTDGIEVKPVTYSENNKAVVTETYVKVPGYLPDKYQQTLIIDPDPDGENKIIFYYTKDEVNGMYVVHYMTQELDGSYTEHSAFEGRAEKGSSVTATQKTIDNFTYNPDHDNNKTEGVISIDIVLELYLYYDRNTYPYKVQYFEEGTNKALLTEKKVDTTMWESIVTEEAPKIENYTLVSTSPASIQIRKDTADPTVNIITFYYAENKVKLNYKVAIGEGTILCESEENIEVSEEVKIKTGIAKGAEAKPAAGYKFEGWYRDEDGTDLLSEELQYFPTKADDVLWEETTYYAKFIPAIGDLTIERTDVSEDEDQVFVYKVENKEDSSFVIYVTVKVDEEGNGSTTIHDLPFGEYIITQENNWSWRYSDNSVSLEHDDEDDEANSTVTFSNPHDSEQWLNGHSSLLKNIFKR